MAVTGKGQPLKPLVIDVKKPQGEEVVIKVGGAGMCRTDLRLIEGKEPRPGFSLPFVLGHENAGYVYSVGERVPSDFKANDRVLVYAVWGDLLCRYCWEGKYMLCPNQRIPGQSYYFGGYAEFMLVPSFRFLYKLDGLDPVDAAPLADAGVTSYSAVKKAIPFLRPDSVVIAYGVGGLASYGIQFLRILFPTSRIVAVSRKKEKLDWAVELGAKKAVLPEKLKEIVNQESKGLGASAAIDFVGREESTMNIARSLENGGAIIEVGMEGDKLSLPTFETTVWQYQLIGSNYATFNELAETVDLVKSGAIKSHKKKISLADANDALEGLKTGTVMGRYVLVP